MKFELRYKRDGWSVDAAIEKGRKPPEWYLDEPQIDSVDLFFIKAFYGLSTERQIGYTIGPIPESKIMEYALYRGLDANTMDLFLYVIKGMDVEYMEWHRKELEQKKVKK